MLTIYLYWIKGILRGYAKRSGRRPSGSQRPPGGPQVRPAAADFPRDVCLTVSRNHAVFLLYLKDQSTLTHWCLDKKGCLFANNRFKCMLLKRKFPISFEISLFILLQSLIIASSEINVCIDPGDNESFLPYCVLDEQHKCSYRVPRDMYHSISAGGCHRFDRTTSLYSHTVT